MAFPSCSLIWRFFGGHTVHSSAEFRLTRNSAVKSCLPSWSWAGWRGEVDPKSWLTGYNYKPGCFSDPGKNYRITPLVKWYSYERENQARKPVDSTMLNFREEYYGKDRQPPPGLTRHECYFDLPRDAGFRFSVDGYPRRLRLTPLLVQT